MIEFTYTLSTLATVVVSLLLLSRTLRDVRLQTDGPRYVIPAARIIVTGFFVSHLGLLLWPEYTRLFWFVSDVGKTLGLGLLYVSYYYAHRRVPLSQRSDLQLSRYHYAEVAEGIVARAFVPGDPVLFTFEAKLVEWVNRVDFPPGASIIFHQARRGCRFEDATKPVEEMVFLARGLAEFSPDLEVPAGVTHTIPAHWEHYYLAKETTIGASIVWPE